MISGVAIVPAAPALLPAVMGAAEREVESVRAAAEAAVTSVVSRLVDARGQLIGRLVIVGVAPRGVEAGSRSYDIAAELTDASFGRTVHLPALPGARPADPMLQAPAGEAPGLVPAPLLIARSICGDVASRVPAADGLWAEALWVTVTPGAAVRYGATLAHDAAPIGLVLVADGAACHQAKAPRAEDARAEDYDDAVCRALASGDPAAVMSLDVELGRELSAEGADLWPLLGAATGTTGTTTSWRGELLWRGTPYGVGWFVATWLR